MAKTIVLADDSSTIRKIVELTFNGTEIRVHAYENGEAAMRSLRNNRPDLVLADVVMPGPNGYEICRELKAEGDELPVVLLSSTFEPYDQELADECGADAHLVKPFESGTLLQTVRELLDPTPQPQPQPVAEVTPEALDAPVVVDQQEPTVPVSEATAEVLGDLDERLIEAVSRVVVERLSEDVVREIASEVVPEMAERIIRERIRQIESEDA